MNETWLRIVIPLLAAGVAWVFTELNVNAQRLVTLESKIAQAEKEVDMLRTIVMDLHPMPKVEPRRIGAGQE